MYLASQNGLVSSASTTAAVTQYDSTELQTAAVPSTAAQSPSMSPEQGISLALPLICKRCCSVYPQEVTLACTTRVSLAVPPCLHLRLHSLPPDVLTGKAAATAVLISQGNSSSQAYGICWHAFGKHVSIWVGLSMLVLGPVHGANLLIHVVQVR